MPARILRRLVGLIRRLGRWQPQVAQLGADGRRLITSMQFMESVDDAFASARAKLEDAGHGVQGATFIYDAHINLPAFRTDCLMLEAHWHAPEIRLTLALPYRVAAQQADGFALYTPRLINSSLPSGCEALPASALFAGMDSFNPPGSGLPVTLMKTARKIVRPRRADSRPQGSSHRLPSGANPRLMICSTSILP